LNKLKIKKNCKFALVGHGSAMYQLYNAFLKKKLNLPIIITHKKKFHIRDIKESKKNKKLYRSINEFPKSAKIFYVKDINDKISQKILLKNQITHIFSTSSRFIFKKNILKNFNNKIFNIHGALLPKERGSGLFTYRIMNSQYFCGATIHLINASLDDGEILLQSKKKIISKESLPIDFLIKTNEIYNKLINSFINTIGANKVFKLKKQKKEIATYMPRFYTEKMGFINFFQSGKDIVKFIKSCSYPYSGAHCLVNNKGNSQINIFNASFLKGQKNHPFTVGKIIFQNTKFIKVIVKDGFLKIETKSLKIKSIKKPNLLGKTLFNYFDDLRNSYLSRTNIFKYF
tara:strand:+ start:248 stop:1279 length:1032 start_codon:yes stop_codon:yes gene_type:complete